MKMHAFVIETPGRLASSELIHFFQSSEVPYTRIQGVVGEHLGESEIEDQIDLPLFWHRIGYRPPKSLIGCGLSHKVIYEIAREMNLDWTLVCEADARPRFSSENLRSMVVKMTEDVDAPTVLQLFSRGERLVRKKPVKLIVGEEGDLGLYDFLYPPRQTVSYLINKKAILIANSEQKLTGPPDWPSWSIGICYIGVYPWLFFETGEQSSIPVPSANRRDLRVRSLSVLSGLDFMIHGQKYPSLKAWIFLVYRPAILRLVWRLLGEKKLTSSLDSPWVL